MKPGEREEERERERERKRERWRDGKLICLPWLTGVPGHHLRDIFLVAQAALALLVDWAGEEIFLRLRQGERRRGGVAQHGARGGGNLGVGEKLVRVVAEGLSDLVLELGNISAVPVDREGVNSAAIRTRLSRLTPECGRGLVS